MGEGSDAKRGERETSEWWRSRRGEDEKEWGISDAGKEKCKVRKRYGKIRRGSAR